MSFEPLSQGHCLGRRDKEVVGYSQLIDRDQKRLIRPRLPYSGPVMSQVAQDQVDVVRHASDHE